MELSALGQNGIETEPEGYTEKYDEADAEEIEIDFESLPRERAELERRVVFNSEVFGRIQTDKTLCDEGGPLHESKLPELGRRIEERLNAEILDEEDREPIELFGPDPRVQPGIKRLHEVVFLGAYPRISEEDKERVIKAKSYEEVKDIFEADKDSSVTPENFSLWRSIFKSKSGGYASGRSVILGEKFPSVYERVMELATTGKLPKSMKALVHELRHISEFSSITEKRKTSYTGKHDYFPLFEAQALYSHPLSGDRKTVVKTIGVLTRKDGPYEFSLDQSLKAVEGIEKFNALGFFQSEIADIIAEGRWVKDTERYYAVDNAIEKRKKERRLSEEDVQLLGDRLWIKRDIQMLRAQVVAQEELFRAVGSGRMKELIDKKMWPHYDVLFSEPEVSFEPGEKQEETLYRADAVAVWPKDEKYPFQIDDRKGFAISWNAKTEAPEARLLHSYVRDDRVIQEIGDVSTLSPEERAALTEEALRYMAQSSNGCLSDWVGSKEYYGLVEKIQDRVFELAGQAQAA